MEKIEVNKVMFQLGMEFAEYLANTNTIATVRVAKSGDGEEAYLYASRTEVREYADDTIGWIDFSGKNYLEVLEEAEAILRRI